MTERGLSNRPSRQKTLELSSVLSDLGHTPESYARVIGRNASGLRRAIKGETKMTPSMARDIVEGLYAEGWRGDPNRIRQLMRAAYGKSGRRGRFLPSGQVIMPDGSVDPPSQPGTRDRSEPPAAVRVRSALAELMRAVGREGVDWVYERVFDVKPGTPHDKNEKD